MNNLARKKLGSLCSVITKGTTPTSLGMKFEDEGIPFLRIQNLSNLMVTLDDVLFISEETHDALKRSKIRAGDFLITIAGTIGRVAIVPDDFPEANCNQAVAILRFDQKRLSPRYLLHWLCTNDALRQISGKKVTATISNLSLGQIKELEIPLPPLNEQKRIAAILDKADAIRRKRQQAIQLADDFLKSVFLDMFGDPVTNQKRWRTERFGNLAEFINGDRSSNYPSGSDIVEDGILFLSTKNIVNDQLSLLSKAFITPQKFESLSRGKLAKNDLVITLRGTLGSCAIFNTEFETGFINAQIMIIRCGASVLPKYLHSLITCAPFKSMLQRIGQGAAVKQLTASQLGSIKIPVPEMEQQKKFVEVLDALKNTKSKQSSAADTVLFESLSQKAFAGEL